MYRLWGWWQQEEIAVTAISGRQWRITDLRFEETDARGLLGFAEQRGGQVEVIPLVRPEVPIIASSLDDAVRLLARNRVPVVQPA